MKDNRKKVRIKAKYRIYISYTHKLMFFIVLLLVSLYASLEIITNSLTYKSELSLNYNEVGTIKYKVFLKENEFYENDYLDENMIYVSSLIKNIEINYLYNFNVDKYIDMNISHQIIGKLTITDDNNNLYFEKEYILDDVKVDQVENNEYSLNKKINIDYDYYNDIANSFKSSYGVNTISNFTVYLRVKKIGSNSGNLDKYNDISLSIPLSKKSIDISMNSKEINNSDKIIIEDNNLVINKNEIFKGAILLLVSIASFVKVIVLLFMLSSKKTPYDKLLNKILKEYDRLIVSTTSLPNFEKYNVIKINSFGELLDARDNLKMPIMYYNIRKHEKCHFYILSNENLYLLTLKSIDLENMNEKN